jgi:4-hydroxyphenylacetate 3-monooxygenase
VRYFQAEYTPPEKRVKLLELTWNLVGTEFGGRRLQYDRFYSAAQHVADMRLYPWSDWSRGRAIVDHCLDG